ncbi:hypothetical protein AB1046_16170 [Promicromonospora sp. Populi]|uniref:hypothetical protein n=1 Tax=Promicromonospora sp. Populi TaxID=3239420 RepID=UPI0034E2B444
MAGIDAGVELERELDLLSGVSPLAARAPRGTGLYRFLASGLASEDSETTPRAPFTWLTEELIIRLGVWWSPSGYARLPTMTPWCIRDRSARYDRGPESWGAPRQDGYFRDDNSIIKKLPLPLNITTTPGHRYAGRALSKGRGFTACHIWRLLGDGYIAGADPWLYSFMPNLVWIPKPIAPLTDQSGSLHIQRILKRTSLALYRDVIPTTATSPYIEYAWSRLNEPELGRTLPLDRLSHFDVDDAFVNRRLKYLDKFAGAAEFVLDRGDAPSYTVSSRYTAGLPLLERHALEAFGRAMTDYAVAVKTPATSGASFRVDVARGSMADKPPALRDVP